MAQVEIAQASATLAALVTRVVAGEDIVLARDGKPIARLIALPATMPRQPGVARHWVLNDAWLLEGTDPNDLDWADGAYADSLGITRPER